MNLHPHSSGRALPLVLGLVALAAIVVLVVADPFGGSSSGDGKHADGDAPDLLTATTDEGADAGAAEVATATLGGLYGEGDAGAIRLRLLWVGSREPVTGQAVQLVNRRGAQVASTPSDANGAVLFAQVRPAKGYALHIEGERFSEVWLRGVSVYSQATQDLGDISLGTDVVLRGRVVDSKGRGVPGSSVSVHTIERGLATKGMLLFLAEQARSVPSSLSQVASDEEGYFAFSALDDGSYTLVARRGGYASRHEADVIVARKRGAGVLTLVLGSPGRASGKVTDAEGKAVAGAQVIALRDVGRRMTTNMLQREVAQTAEDGTYTIDTLAAGQRYRFGVLAEGYAPVYEISGTEITEAVLEKDFALVKGGDLHGVVTDEATGKPIADARVVVYVGNMGWGGRGNRSGNEKATADTRLTDAEGEFRFEALNPGPVPSAVVKAPGYVSATYSMWPPPGNTWPEIKEGECQEVTVELKRGGTIRGTVKTAEGDQPVQGAEVTVMQTGWAAMASMFYGSPTALTSAEGGYELVGVVPGKYRILAVADGFTPAGGEEGVEVEVPESGGTVERNLSLISAGAVAGVVVDPNGEPIAGVRIRLRPGPRNDEGENGGGRGGRRGMDMARRILMAGRNPADLSDEKGVFRLEGIATAQNWIVYGESDEYVTGESKPFKLAAGDTKTVELKMLPGGALRGRVVDENGRWLPGVRVQVGRLTEELAGMGRLNSWRADRALDPRTFTTDEEGRFLATNLKPGRTLVKASKDDYITFYKRNVTITPGETYDNYTIALSAGETVTGTVTDAEGKPIRRAMVAVTTRASADDQGESGTQDASEDVEPAMFARTDDKGRYEIEHVKPGTYNVVIWFAPGFKSWRDDDAAAAHRDIVVPARDLDFKLNKAEPRAGIPGGGGGNRGR